MHFEQRILNTLTRKSLKYYFWHPVNLKYSGVARMLRALVQRCVMGPQVTKQLRNSFCFFLQLHVGTAGQWLLSVHTLVNHPYNTIIANRVCIGLRIRTIRGIVVN